MAKQFETNVGHSTETTRKESDPDRAAGGQAMNPKFLDRDDPRRPASKHGDAGPKDA